MQSRPSTSISRNVTYQQVAHILVAGLWTSEKVKLIRHLSETPLEQVDIARDAIPTKLPNLVMGQLRVDSRLTANIWGAPDQWQHDYVNYLVNIKSILADRGDQHRVIGMMVVVDSLPTASQAEESKLLRLIETDWQLPYIVLASHPYHPHARQPSQLREVYQIPDAVPLYPCDVSDYSEANRALINLLYHAM